MLYHYETTSGKPDQEPLRFCITANNERHLRKIWSNPASNDQGKVHLQMFLKTHPDYDYRGSKLVSITSAK